MSESIWKREIHLGLPRRNKDRGAGYLDPASLTERPTGAPSFWKKEIRFRKPKDERLAEKAAKSAEKQRRTEEKAAAPAARNQSMQPAVAAFAADVPEDLSPQDELAAKYAPAHEPRPEPGFAPPPRPEPAFAPPPPPEPAPSVPEWAPPTAPMYSTPPPEGDSPAVPPASAEAGHGSFDLPESTPGHAVESDSEPAALLSVPAAPVRSAPEWSPPSTPAYSEPAPEEELPVVTPPAAAAEAAYTPPAIEWSPPSTPAYSEPAPEEELPVVPPAAAAAAAAVIQPPTQPAAAEPPHPPVAPAQKSAPKAKRAKGRHRAKKIVGLKVGASQLTAARVSNNGSIELLQVARQPLEPGIVVAGELRDPDALATALKQFFRKHKLPKSGIRLGISNNRIGVRVFEISGVDDTEQLRNAVRFRAQDALPISVDEAVMDFHVVGETVDEEGAPAKRVVLVVAHRDLVERYAAAFRKAGLKLMGVDLEAFALLRSLAADMDPDAQEGERSGLVVVSIGSERSTFAVSDGRVCEFTRVLDWGGASLDTAIVGALEVTPGEAQTVKLGLSLADASLVPETLTPEQADAARDAIRRGLEVFARDLVSSLRFYQSQPDSLAIRELVLSGGTAELPGLAEELERLLDVRVRVGDPLCRVRVGRQVKERHGLGSLAAAIGLGIEE